MNLEATQLASGNIQVRFEYMEGRYKGLYGYIISRPEEKPDEVVKTIENYIFEKKNCLPYSIMSISPITSPLYIQ